MNGGLLRPMLPAMRLLNVASTTSVPRSGTLRLLRSLPTTEFSVPRVPSRSIFIAARGAGPRLATLKSTAKSLRRSFATASEDPRSASSAVLAVLVGAGAGAFYLLSDDSRVVQAKSRQANSRELCMLTRLNDAEALERLFPTKQTPAEGSTTGSQPQTDEVGPDPNGRHPMGWTPLLVAAANNNPRLVKFWLEHGAEIDITDEYSGPSSTGSRSSGASGSFEAIYDMIRTRQQEFSAYLDPRAGFEGFTALHYACLNGNKPIIEMLLERGADPTKKDAEGRTPRDYLDDRASGINDHGEVTKLFEVAEKKFAEEKRRRDREHRRKYPLEAQLKEQIIGQEGPINSVASAIRRRENGWHDADKPLVFLFLGSSGIGKTELAKQLAAYVHKDNLRKGFLRLDLSEFQTKHEVSKFIGAPPGYIGHEDTPALIQKLKEAPNAIVLLDEVEKAHPDVLTVMLQLFDEGRITDGKGITVSCPEAIFVMTSNLAQQEIASEAEHLRKSAADPAKPTDNERSLGRTFIDKTIYPILRAHFQRDEFLGRINEILFFLPFSDSELKQLATKELQSWQKRAQDRHQIKLEWDEEVIRVLVGEYQVSYGARSIKHGVERKAINQIARAHEHDEIGPESTVKLYVENGEIRMKATKPSGSKGSGGLFGSLFGGNKTEPVQDNKAGDEKKKGSKIIEVE